MKIKDICEDERPRERLFKYGPKAMGNAELLAIIIGQGSYGENALDLANKLLTWNDIAALSRKNISQLKSIWGIGEAKACQIISCFELGRRLASFNRKKKKKIDSPRDAARMLMAEMSTLKKEHFKGLYLDSRKGLIKDETIFVGTLNSSVVHPREVFESAISEGAAAVILAHNHPSGDSSPSKEDISVTLQMVEAGRILGIEIIDHIIIGHNNYCSMLKKGYFPNI